MLPKDRWVKYTNTVVGIATTPVDAASRKLGGCCQHAHPKIWRDDRKVAVLWKYAQRSGMEIALSVDNSVKIGQTKYIGRIERTNEHQCVSGKRKEPMGETDIP